MLRHLVILSIFLLDTGRLFFVRLLQGNCWVSTFRFRLISMLYWWLLLILRFPITLFVFLIVILLILIALIVICLLFTGLSCLFSSLALLIYTSLFALFRMCLTLQISL